MKKFTLLLSAMLLACATNLWADDSWVKVSIDQLTSSDVFIIVDSTSGCAIPNNPTKQPLEVSIMKDGAWDFTNIADNLKWNITGNNNEGYVISPNGDATKRLYCQNDNNGVRVGTPEGTTYNLFWDATVNKLKQQVPDKNNKTITRWIGYYSSNKDWRCYNSGTATNIKNTVTRFYKLVTVANTVSVAVADGQEEMGSVAMSYKANSNAAEWTEATKPVEIAGEGAEVFQFVATPAEGYKFAGWTTTGDITLNDKNAATAVGNSAKETSVVTAHFERDATLTSLTISGTATKLNYFVGDTFNPAGLVVTATYSDGATDKVTDQVDWTFTPAELALATTAVSVVATWNEVSSDPYEVKDIVVTDPVRFEKWIGEVVEGEYLLVDVSATDSVAMNTTVSSDRLQYSKVVINAKGQIIEPSADVVWKIARDSAFWTIANGEKFAAGNGKNKVQLLQAVGNQARWKIAATETGHTIVNYGNQKANVNATLRRNDTYGFSCYAAGTGTAPVLYKKVTDETFVTVTVIVNDASMGSVYGGGRYAVGATATLTAVPAAGYKLIGWSNDNQITTTTQSFTVEEEITITANFAKGATAIDNVAVETPALKTIENGQLVILRDGVKYNAMGVRLQ